MSRLSKALPNKSTMREQKKKEHKSPAHLYIIAIDREYLGFSGKLSKTQISDKFFCYEKESRNARI